MSKNKWNGYFRWLTKYSVFVASWACVSLFLPTVLAAQTARDANVSLSGIWSSGTLEKVGAALRPECSYISVTERKVTINPTADPNIFQGEWVRWTRLTWMNSDNRRCRWYPDEQQFEPVLGAIWTYRLKGHRSRSEENSIKVDGNYDNCLGNGCAQMKPSGDTFHTELKLIGANLVDTNETEEQDDDVAFVRLSDEVEMLDDARTAVEGYLKLLDRGNIDNFYQSATSAQFRHDTSSESFHSAISGLQSKDGLIDSRHYLITSHILYAPMISKEKGDYVLYSNMIHSDKGLSGVEFIFLVREGTEWKVYWINYGS
jgi:hypothetical protein